MVAGNIQAEAHMSWLKLKIPPPLVALFCALCMWQAAPLLPAYTLSLAMRWLLVAIYLLLGASFILSALFAFRQQATTANPMHPEQSSALVVHGVYRISRNPMYCGMAALLLAWAAYLQSPLSVLGVLAFIGYITQFQIKPEEQALAARFGDGFQRYRERVRRWL